jgi:integrase
MKYATGVKIIPEQWNQEKQQAYISFRLPELDNKNNELVNTRLDEINNQLCRFKELLADNPENFCTFAELIKAEFMPKKQPAKSKRKAQADQLTAEQEKSIKLFRIIKDSVSKNTSLNTRTIDNYITKGLKAFQAFSDQRSKPISSFEMIDNDLLEEFKEFLESGAYLQDNGKSYAIGTLNSIIKYAVAAIKNTSSEYLPKSKADLLKTTSITDKTADNNEIALRDDEVIKLWKYKPVSNEDEIIRDMFVLLCTTGQRISDLGKIGDGIQEQNGTLSITIVQEKTSHKIIVPIIFQLAKEILEKYNRQLPPCDKDTINHNIKRIAKEAGITGIETVSTHYQGSNKPAISQHDRYDRIASHTGRRTFVSLLATRGWTYENIGKYTGQRNVKTVEGYNKATAIDMENFKKLSPENRLQLLSETDTKPDTRPVKTDKDLFGEVFAIPELTLLLDMKHSGVNIYGLPEISLVYSKLKNVRGFDKVIPILKDKGFTIDDEMRQFIWELCRANFETKAYNIFQYKCLRLGISDAKPTPEDILGYIWDQEFREQQENWQQPE